MDWLNFQITFISLAILTVLIFGYFILRLRRETNKERFLADGCLVFAVLAVLISIQFYLEAKKDSTNQWQEQKQLEQKQIDLLQQISDSLKNK